MKKTVILLMSLLYSQIVWSADAGIVIKVKGLAEIQSHQMQPAVAIKRGQKIQIGDGIKTANKTKLNILNVDGSILRVKGSKEFIYKGSKKDASAVGGWALALKELNDKRTKKSVAMTRGAVATLPGQDMWMNLMKQSLSEKDAEDVLILSAWYGQHHQYNRQAALVWKLGNDLPDERLKRQAIQGYSNQFEWHVHTFIQGHRSEATFNDAVTEGDQLQMVFTPRQESYYYLFFTTQAQKESIKTYLLYPSHLDATKIVSKVKYYEARVNAGVEHRTPKYTLDRAVGYEHLWGWSCSGPILDAAVTQGAIHAVKQHLSTSKLLTSNEVAKHMPAMCASFSLSLKHR